MTDADNSQGNRIWASGNSQGNTGQADPENVEPGNVEPGNVDPGKEVVVGPDEVEIEFEATCFWRLRRRRRVSRRGLPYWVRD